jgi:hypothetical protein
MVGPMVEEVIAGVTGTESDRPDAATSEEPPAEIGDALRG